MDFNDIEHTQLLSVSICKTSKLHSISVYWVFHKIFKNPWVVVGYQLLISKTVYMLADIGTDDQLIVFFIATL